MQRNTAFLLKTSAAALTLALAACGGGGGDSTGSASSSAGSQAGQLSGVAASGAPLANATITAIDSQGKTCQTTSNASGQYQLSLAQCPNAPYLLTASGLQGDNTSVSLHSVALGAGTVHITTLTEVLSQRLLTQQLNTPLANALTSARVDAAQAELRKNLASALSTLGLDANAVDFLSGAFQANHTGLDQVLDSIRLSKNAAGDTILIAKDNGGAVLTIPAGGSALWGGAAFPLIDVDSGVETLAANLQAAFRQSDATALQSLLAADFLDSGDNAVQWAANALDGGWSDVTVGHPLIGSCLEVDGSGSGKCTHRAVDILFSSAKHGKAVLHTTIERNGKTWQLAGNQRPFDLEVVPSAYLNQDGSSMVGLSLSAGLDSTLGKAIRRVEVSLNFQSTSSGGFASTSFVGCNQPWLCWNGGVQPSSSNFWPSGSNTGGTLPTDGGWYRAYITVNYTDANGVARQTSFWQPLHAPSGLPSAGQYASLSGSLADLSSQLPGNSVKVAYNLPAGTYLGDVTLNGVDAGHQSWLANKSMLGGSPLTLSFANNGQPVVVSALSSLFLTNETPSGWQLTRQYTF